MIRPDQLFNAPIPGQSLTNSPDSRAPYEMPPQFAAPGPALDHMFRTITSKKFMGAFNKLFKEDRKFFLDKIAAQMLQEGFINGLWTVDVMLLMVEPMICMLVWLACMMELPVSFSTDTGAEDRTGFEDVMSAMMMTGGVGFEQRAEETQAAAQGTDVTDEGTAQSPMVNQPAASAPVQAAPTPAAAPMQSPLVTGA